jgi:hypothetical protein
MTALTPPSLREIAFNVAGAFRLARFDLSGLSFLDLSAYGAARSFWAAALVAPAYFALIGLRAGFSASAGAEAVLLEALGYVVSWCAFPVILSYLMQGLGADNRYYAYLSAYNWSAVVQMSAYLPATLIAESGLAPADVGAGLVLGVMLAMLFYQWFIVRVTLGLSRLLSVALVLMDLVAAMAVNAMVDLAY